MHVNLCYFIDEYAFSDPLKFGVSIFMARESLDLIDELKFRFQYSWRDFSSQGCMNVSTDPLTALSSCTTVIIY